MSKDRFMFFRNIRDVINSAETPEEKMQVFDAICDYAFEGIEPKDKWLKMVVQSLKPTLDYKGVGAPRGNKNAQKTIKSIKTITDNKNNYEQLKQIQTIKQETETETRNKKLITPLDNKLSISPYRGNELCSCDCKRVAKFEINGSKFCGQHTRIELSKLGRLDLMPRQEKLSFSDVSDWDSLFRYWEENKKGGAYKNEESRQRMLAKLKELTNNDFNLAKLSVCFAIDNKYQGFCNGSELYYKPPRNKPPERTLAEKQREEQLMDEMINRVWKDD